MHFKHSIMLMNKRPSLLQSYQFSYLRMQLSNFRNWSRYLFRNRLTTFSAKTLVDFIPLLVFLSPVPSPLLLQTPLLFAHIPLKISALSSTSMDIYLPMEDFIKKRQKMWITKTILWRDGGGSGNNRRYSWLFGNCTE